MKPTEPTPPPTSPPPTTTTLEATANATPQPWNSARFTYDFRFRKLPPTAQSHFNSLLFTMACEVIDQRLPAMLPPGTTQEEIDVKMESLMAALDKRVALLLDHTSWRSFGRDLVTDWLVALGVIVTLLAGIYAGLTITAALVKDDGSTSSLSWSWGGVHTKIAVWKKPSGEIPPARGEARG